MKKGVSIVLSFVLVLTMCISGEGRLQKDIRANRVQAAESDTTVEYRYFYHQLPDEARELYDAMYDMYTQGIFKTGKGDYDLLANGHVTREQLEGYASGNPQLLKMFGTARDAFSADYPDIFYVDFSYLTLRVTRDTKGEYHARLGAGRGDDYYAEGFENEAQVEAAVKEYNTAVENIVKKAQSATAIGGDSLAEAQVRFVHDEIINHTSYRLEDKCKPENIGFVRNAYGALVKGESVCEGYSRALKSVLDRLHIPCVLVYGVYRHTENEVELHMWNYVSLAGKWYAVDATMDDPISEKKTADNRDGYENTEYLLVGEDVMSRRHVSSGIMSEAEFEFSYPALEMLGCGVERVSAPNSLLKVTCTKNDTYEGETSATYRVSYKNMGYKKAAEQGFYIVAKFAIYYENTGEWLCGDWAYADPNLYHAFTDTDTDITIPVPHCQYVEFGVTDREPPYLRGEADVSYQGDPMLLLEDTGVMYNESAHYVAPPYIKSASPSTSGKLTIGQTYHVSVTYDDELKLVDGAEKMEYEITHHDDVNATGNKYCTVENFSWDGASTVTFDFTPSKMWADDSIIYQFNLKGVVGKRSNKVPNPIVYAASFPCAVCAYRSQGYFWNIFGKPSLVDNSDLSTADWEMSDGTKGVSPNLVKQMVLVASSVSEAQAEAMNDKIEEKMTSGELSKQKILKSETYNINFTVCKKQVVKTGDSVRVSVGFPQGYGPEDAGVTFKAYHFDKDKDGKITGVQEIPCIVTQYGLLILCNSFSPFAIAAVEAENNGQAAKRNAVVTQTVGGSVSGADKNLFTLAPGGKKTIQIKADDGYEIDTVSVAGKAVTVANKTEMNLEVKYEDITATNGIVDVKFVAASVRKEEEKRGEAPIAVEFKPDLSGGSQTPGSSGGSQTPSTEQTPGSGGESQTPGAEQTPGSGGESQTPAPEGTDAPDQVPDLDKTDELSPTPSVKMPEKVKGAAAKSSSVGKVKLTWHKIEGADGYYVFRSGSESGEFVKIANVKKGSYTDGEATAGKAYRYKVCAYKKSGKTYYLGKKSAECRVIAKPKAPSKVKRTRISRTATNLSFNKVKRASYYLVYQYDKNTGKYKKVYRIKGKKRSFYDEDDGKWVRSGSVSVSGDRVTCSLSGLLGGSKIRYCVRTVVTKSGYPKAESKDSKKVNKW